MLQILSICKQLILKPQKQMLFKSQREQDGRVKEDMLKS